MRILRRLWAAKWIGLRLAIAVFVAAVVAGDTQARLARLQLAALPDFDYISEAGALGAEGRFGEALTVVDAGLADEEVSSEPKKREKLEALQAKIIAERDGWLRKAKSVGMGALSGRGKDLESLLGAVASDFFLVGDVRDLVIEGGKQLLDGESDEFIILLSFIGVVTTLAPEIDWAPAVLKAAKRAGSISAGLIDVLKRAIKGRDAATVTRVCEDVARVSRKAGPAAAGRALRLADNADELSDIAKFVELTPNGAFALHVGGRASVTFWKEAGERAGAVIAAGARKGTAGVRFLGTRSGRALVQPHWLVGAAKGFWKGNAELLITRALDRFGNAAWWALPAAVAWAFVELLLLSRVLAVGGKTAPSPRGMAEPPATNAAAKAREPASRAER